jgi:hypothetical protein
MVFGQQYRSLPDLPDIIEAIDVHLQRLLPSLVSLSLDLVMSEDVTNKLADVQAANHLPRVTLKPLFTLSKRGSHFSIENPDHARAAAVRGYLQSIHQYGERLVADWVPGMFSSNPIDKNCVLPSLEVYHISGISSSSDFWENAADLWWSWQSFGFEHHTRMWCSDECLFMVARRERGVGYLPTRVVITSEKTSVHEVQNSASSGYTAPLVIEATLSGFESRIGLHRQRVFGELSRGLSKWLPSRKSLRLNSQMQADHLSLRRLILEMEQDWRFILHGSKLLRRFTRISKDAADLQSIVVGHIQSTAKRLREHSDLMADALSTQVSERVTLGLYWLTLILALMTAFLVFSEAASLIEKFLPNLR